MCYSAMVWADYRKYVKLFGARISIQEFVKLFELRAAGGRVKVPKAMEAAFQEAQSDDERRVKALIDHYNAQETTRLQQDLFKQRTRLADAERKLATKFTKAATESKRVAADKIDWTVRRLAEIERTSVKERDSRIFPGHYAPVMVMENGERVVKPMRYLCRPERKPVDFDRRYSGAYNARLDNLEGFYWRDLFGVRHGVMVVNSFFENVHRHRLEQRELGAGEKEESIVLEFNPNPTQDMYIACLWSHWTAPGEPDLLSFAAITDDPPAEVAAAGHDRCIVMIRPEHVDEWLNPSAGDLRRQYAILDDLRDARFRPFFEHRLAA